MTCTNCGRALRANARFCPYCRQPVPSPATPGKDEDQPLRHKISAYRRWQSYSYARRALVVAGIAVVLCLIAVVVIVSLPGGAADQTTSLTSVATSGTPSSTTQPTAPSTSSPDALTGATAHYENSAYSFAFDYPAGWKLEQNRVDVFGDTAMGRYGEIAVTSQGSPKREIRMEFWAPDYLTRLTEAGGSIQVWASQAGDYVFNEGNHSGVEIVDDFLRSDIGGFEAYRLASTDGFTYRLSVLILTSDYACSITCRAQDDDRDQAKPLFDAFLRSYAPIPVASTTTSTLSAETGGVIALLPDGSSRPPVLGVAPEGKSMIVGDATQVKAGMRVGTGGYQAVSFKLESEDVKVVTVEGDIIRAVGPGSTKVLLTAGQLQQEIYVEVFPDRAAYDNEMQGTLYDGPVFTDGRVELDAWYLPDTENVLGLHFNGGVHNLTAQQLELTRACFSVFTASGAKIAPEADSLFLEPIEGNGRRADTWSAMPDELVGFTMRFLKATAWDGQGYWLVYDDGTSLIPIPANGNFLASR